MLFKKFFFNNYIFFKVIDTVLDTCYSLLWLFHGNLISLQIKKVSWYLIG